MSGAGSAFVDAASGDPIPGTPRPMPCPWCGAGYVEITVKPADPSKGLVEFAVAQCCDCAAEGPTGSDAVDVAERWNNRVQAGSRGRRRVRYPLTPAQQSAWDSEGVSLLSQ